MRYAIVNLGCKVNRVESDSLAAAFGALGMQPASDSTVDLVVVNTCTVTGEAEKKTRKAVRRALRDHPHATVIVTGCAAAIDAQIFLDMDERVVVAGKLELAEAAKTTRGLSELAPGLADRMRDAHESDGLSAVRAGGCEQDGPEKGDFAAVDALRIGEGYPTRVGIKVQDGCNNACTYCIVHVARGRSWSRPAVEILDEFSRYARAGVREIVLSGINIGTYRDGAMDLPDLLEAMLAAHPDVRLRISSIEPKNVTDRLIELMARSDGRIARHLHLPLQAGSTRVLREMARPYSAEWYCELVDRLYKAMPGLSLSTDIIVGFPGESDDDFLATLEVARRCRFSKIHVFPYSRREGTPAAARADQIDAALKASRAAELALLGDRLRAEAYESRRGTIEAVLVEAHGAGMTESYFEIAVPESCLPGDLVELALP